MKRIINNKNNFRNATNLIASRFGYGLYFILAPFIRRIFCQSIHGICLWGLSFCFRFLYLENLFHALIHMQSL